MKKSSVTRRVFRFVPSSVRSSRGSTTVEEDGGVERGRDIRGKVRQSVRRLAGELLLRFNETDLIEGRCASWRFISERWQEAHSRQLLS